MEDLSPDLSTPISKSEEIVTNSNPPSSARASSPSHTDHVSHAPCSENDSEKAELGSSVCNEPRVQRSPPIGDMAEGKTKEAESATGSDANVGVDISEVAAIEQSSHSPIPIPLVTADAGSRSHSPVPIPVASAIDTAMKIDLSNSTSESDNLLSLKQGIKNLGYQQTFVTLGQFMQHFDVCNILIIAFTNLTKKNFLCDFIGDEPEVYVTTPLSPDGSFWIQLAAAEQREFQSMVEELQKCCREEPPTPIFFNPGDLCAAQFYEDSCWYRAKVEEIVEGEVSLGGWGSLGGWESLGGWGIGRLWGFFVWGDV